jgi:hypothetical protein
MPIYIDCPMKSGILPLQLRGNLADSDPRLQLPSGRTAQEVFKPEKGMLELEQALNLMK